MATITQNLYIDLNTKRFVRQNNSAVGLRSLVFTEGNLYSGNIALFKDGVEYSGDVTSVEIEIGNTVNDIALVRFTGESEIFNLSINGDLIRQFLYNSTSKESVVSMTLTVDNQVYVISNITGNLISNPDGNTGNFIPSWDSVTDKPTDFPPSAHNHPISDVNGLQGALNAKADVSSVSDKVDKVAGKGLSQEDYTTTEKNKLSGIEATKLVHVADSTARKALTSGQVKVGDMVKESGNLETIIVSGAGTSIANGTYVYNGMLYGFKSFIKGEQLIFWAGAWNVGRVDDTATYYLDTTDSETTDPTDGALNWIKLSDGANPVPTLTQGANTPMGKIYTVLDVANLDNDSGWLLENPDAPASFQIHEVTNAQRLAGVRGDGTTPLVKGDMVRVTDQGNRIEVALQTTFNTDSKWQVLVNSFRLYISPEYGPPEMDQDLVVNGIVCGGDTSTYVGWFRLGQLITHNGEGSFDDPYVSNDDGGITYGTVYDNEDGFGAHTITLNITVPDRCSYVKVGGKAY